jgi:hypothetical protein
MDLLKPKIFYLLIPKRKRKMTRRWKRSHLRLPGLHPRYRHLRPQRLPTNIPTIEANRMASQRQTVQDHSVLESELRMMRSSPRITDNLKKLA